MPSVGQSPPQWPLHVDLKDFMHRNSMTLHDALHDALQNC